ALADRDEVGEGVGDAGGGGGADDEVFQRGAGGDEQADAAGVVGGGAVLLVGDPLGLACRRVRVEGAVALDAGRPGAQVAGAAVAGGVGDAHALEAARIVRRELLALHAHEDFGVAELVAQALAAFGKLGAEAFAVGGGLGHADQGLR